MSDRESGDGLLTETMGGMGDRGWKISSKGRHDVIFIVTRALFKVWVQEGAMMFLLSHVCHRTRQTSEEVCRL